jgi:peptidoglycan/xylan/chitin deacetylase (PgdA/CDA1 family)
MSKLINPLTPILPQARWIRLHQCPRQENRFSIDVQAGRVNHRPRMFDLTLSFDNGPDPAVTPFVLDVLRDRAIAATFFVIGRRAAAPGAMALCRRAREEGHWIGNHTWSHEIPLGARGEPDLAEQEIARTQRLIAPLAHPHRWFRPFGGGGNLDRRLLNQAVLQFLAAAHYSCVLWNAVPRDWADPEGWVETALAQCRARPWTLLVLHDLPTGAMRHLPRFLDAAREQGARFRQDFPGVCVPMLDGAIVRPMDDYVAAA